MKKLNLKSLIKEDRQCYQDGADFYDDDSGELIASYKDLVKGDYDTNGAEQARIKFQNEHPDYGIVYPFSEGTDDDFNDDDEEFQPEENDCFIADVVRGGYDISCDGKFLTHVDEYDEAISTVSEWQDKNNYFPNTWFIDDHGGHELVNLHDKLSQESISLKNLVPEEFQRSPIDGMRKQQAVKYITKNFKVYEKLRGFFNDDSWKPINGIIGDLQRGMIPISIEKTEYQKEGGVPARKIWWCEIPFTNQNRRPDKLNVIITAAGAGSVQDPLDRYDVTFVIN